VDARYERGHDGVSRPSPALLLPRRRLLGRDRHRAVGKARGDLQRAAERLDVAQVAHIHVAAAFELGDRGLADREPRSQFLLRDGARLAQFVQRQSRVQRGRFVVDARLARGRKAFGQFIEGPVSAQVSSLRVH
jgi:hypothetical protein